MKFVYKPEGAEPRSWDFDATKMLNVEAEAIERQTGLTYAEFTRGLAKGSTIALHALLWVLLKRQAPTLKYDDVTFNISELDFEVDAADAQTIVAALDHKRAQGAELSDDEQRLYDSLVEQGVQAPDPKESRASSTD